jgi:hypothetical protein
VLYELKLRCYCLTACKTFNSSNLIQDQQALARGCCALEVDIARKERGKWTLYPASWCDACMVRDVKFDGLWSWRLPNIVVTWSYDRPEPNICISFKDLLRSCEVEMLFKWYLKAKPRLNIQYNISPLFVGHDIAVKSAKSLNHNANGICQGCLESVILRIFVEAAKSQFDVNGVRCHWVQRESWQP